MPDQDLNFLFEQYKLVISSAEGISVRRATANNFLLSVNAFLVAIHTFGSSLRPDTSWHIVIPLAGLIICISWWTLIKSYRNLNSAKFKVIHEIELQLPVQPYKDEWNQISKLHIPLSRVEQFVPFVFAALYLLLIIA